MRVYIGKRSPNLMTNSEIQVEEFKPIELSEELSDWLRSTPGLQELDNSWISALYSLKKSAYFTDKDWKKKEEKALIYNELKADSFVAGISFSKKVDISSESVGIEHYDEKDGSVSTHEILMDEGTVTYKMTVHFTFGFKNSVADHFHAFPENIKKFLCAHIWSTIKNESILRVEESIAFDDFAYGEVPDKSRPDGWIYHWDYREGGLVEYKFIVDYNIISNNDDLAAITGCGFTELCKINPKNNLHIKGSHLDGAYEKLTLKLGRWEEKLTGYLLDRGFIVSLEPKIFFPDREIENYREPDLMVFHMGRVIAIEIDDRSHLTRTKRWKSGKIFTEANIDKWSRDRLLDKLFLLNGIPVLRVWFEEVQDHPEKVMSEVMRVFESLGGQRMNYQ
tara:strand:- start:819 stop:1997 length:1179 start_codon:yes stop_codon:yes gene_type:complete